MKFVRGDLVFWVASRQDKFWGVVKSVRNDSVYVVFDSGGHWVSNTDLRSATVEQVVRYQRRRWQKSAMSTRNAIEHAQSLV